jgi:hypothetical protein
MMDSIDATEGIAILGALGTLAGAAAWLAAEDDGDTVFNIPADFGAPSIPEDSVDTSNPDGSDTSDDWLGDVGDSAPEPDGGTDTDTDLDLGDDTVDTSNPDGSDTSDDWLGDVGDSAPETDGGTVGVVDPEDL